MATESDSQSIDADKSSTTSGYISEKENQRVRSHECSDESDFSPPSDTMSQWDYYRSGPSTTPAKYNYQWSRQYNTTAGQSYANQRPPNPNVRPQPKIQLHYSEAVPSVAGVKSIHPRRHMFNVSVSSSTATATSAEWNPATYGNKRADGGQLISTGDRYSQNFGSGYATNIEYQRCVDSGKAFDGGEGYNLTSLTRKVFDKADRDIKFESEQRSLIAQKNVRSKYPSLQTRYSPEVLGEATDFNPLSTYHPRGPTNSPQQSNKENENADGASRQDTLLPVSREPKTTAIEGDHNDTIRSNIELTTSVDASGVTESLSTSTLTAIKSTPTPPANESADTGGNSPKTTPVIEMQPLKFTDPTTIIGNESIEDGKISPPESPSKNIDRSTTRIPATFQSDGLNETIVTEPALSDHCYNKPMGAESSVTSKLSSAEFIHPTNIGDVSNVQTNIWLAQYLQEIEQSNVSIPAASQNDVNEIVITVPADPSEEKTVEATPQLLPAAPAISSSQTSSLKQPNVVRTTNPIQPTASKPNSSVKTQRRPYERPNKIVIHSNDVIEVPMGAIIQPVPSNATRVNLNMIVFDQKSSNIQKNAGPIQTAARSKFPAKSEAKSSSINLLKRKNADALPISNKLEANSTVTTVTSLKRKNKENLPLPPAPAKVQKVEKPAQVHRKNTATSSTSVNLPNVTIERMDQSASIAGVSQALTSGQESFQKCLQSLQRNGVSVFKVPPKQSSNATVSNVPQNKALDPSLDKYIEMLQKNDVTIARVNKNASRM